MDERAHDDHFHTLRSHEGTEAFGDVASLGHHRGELTFDAIPCKEYGEVGSRCHPGEILFTLYRNRNHRFCTNKKRQSILGGPCGAGAAIPGDGDTFWPDRLGVARHHKQGTAAVEKNVLDHRTLQSIGNVGCIEDRTVMDARQLNKTPRSRGERRTRMFDDNLQPRAGDRLAGLVRYGTM